MKLRIQVRCCSEEKVLDWDSGVFVYLQPLYEDREIYHRMSQAITGGRFDAPHWWAMVRNKITFFTEEGFLGLDDEA